MKVDHQSDLARFLRELQAESDRGLALVGAAVIDDKLRATLAAFFVQCSVVPRLLEQPNAPLSTFSVRADLCLTLGLIDEFEHSEINVVRKVRNEFAHGLHGTTFNTEPIMGYCSGLKRPEGGANPWNPTGDPRFRFTNSIISLVMRLYYRPEWVKLDRRVAKEWVNAEQVRWRSIVDEPPATTEAILVIGTLGKPPESDRD